MQSIKSLKDNKDESPHALDAAVKDISPDAAGDRSSDLTVPPIEELEKLGDTSRKYLQSGRIVM